MGRVQEPKRTRTQTVPVRADSSLQESIAQGFGQIIAVVGAADNRLNPIQIGSHSPKVATQTHVRQQLCRGLFGGISQSPVPV